MARWWIDQTRGRGTGRDGLQCYGQMDTRDMLHTQSALTTTTRPPFLNSKISVWAIHERENGLFGLKTVLKWYPIRCARLLCQSIAHLNLIACSLPLVYQSSQPRSLANVAIGTEHSTHSHTHMGLLWNGTFQRVSCLHIARDETMSWLVSSPYARLCTKLCHRSYFETYAWDSSCVFCWMSELFIFWISHGRANGNCKMCASISTTRWLHWCVLYCILRLIVCAFKGFSLNCSRSFARSLLFAFTPPLLQHALHYLPGLLL